jgi:hypothetical protein
MSKIFKMLGLAVVLALGVGLAVVAGDYGPWYFAWLVGTTMIVLIAAAGAVLFDTQETTNGGAV